MVSEVIASRPPSPGLRRLQIGLAVSGILHLIAVAGIGTRPLADPQWPRKLEVFLESPAARKFEPGMLTADAPAETFATPASASGKPLESPPQQAAPETPPSREAQLNLGAPAEEYYTSQQVDVRAEQINEVDLIFPERAYGMRLEGRVVVRLYISEKGSVDGLTIVEATPPGHFEKAAAEASAALRFSPAMRYGRAVKSQKTIEVRFDPYESINVP
jgi:TonB family protein